MPEKQPNRMSGSAAGDVAFSGHVAGEEAVVPGFPPQADFISTLGSLYLRDGATGQITSIAHAGDPAPGPICRSLLLESSLRHGRGIKVLT
jgi:hypothetical protein